jgi:hypothetical protein
MNARRLRAWQTPHSERYLNQTWPAAVDATAGENWAKANWHAIFNRRAALIRYLLWNPHSPTARQLIPYCTQRLYELERK